MNEIDSFIQTLRDSFRGSITVYTRGSCYQFYLVLKQIYPQAVAWYSEDHDHIVTCINWVLYDINGVAVVDDSYQELKNYQESIINAVSNYKFNGLIDHIQCPNCDHTFKFEE